MSDLLQVSDLEKAKKHDTFHSEVVTGKAGGVSTGANIDYATNAVTGQVQKTLPKILDDLDWSYVGLFADGVTFTDKTDFAVDAVGTQWIYTGSLPFSATAGTVPSEPLYQAVRVNDHNLLTGLNPANGTSHNAADIAYKTSTVGDAIDLVFADVNDLTTELSNASSLIDAVDFRSVANSASISALQSQNATQDSRIDAVEGGQGAGVIGYATQAELFVNLNFDDGSIGYVTNDTTATNNGTYRKSGATGTGSWVQSSDDLASQAYQSATENAALLSASTQDIEVITGTDSNMNGVNGWAVAIGAPVINITGGKMEVDFPAGTDASIQLENIFEVGEAYGLRVKVELLSGISSLVQIGSTVVSSPSSGPNSTLTRPVLGEVYEIYQEITAATANMFIGVAAADNNGLRIAIEYIEARKVDVSSRELIDRVDITSKQLSGNLLDSYSSLIKYPNRWVQDVGSPTINYNDEEGSISVAMASGANTNIIINDVIEIGEDYQVSLTCRLVSGTASKVIVGDFSSGGNGHGEFIPTNEFVEHKTTFTGAVSYFSIGTLAADNLGQTIEIKDIFIFKAGDGNALDVRVDSIEKELITGNILDDNSETMTAPTSWMPQVGAPTLDYTTNTGALTVDLGSGINRSISITNPPLVIGRVYDIAVDLKVVGGVPSQITLGEFTSGTSNGVSRLTPTTDWVTYKFSITATVTYFAIGVLAGSNLGTVLAVDNVIIKDRARRLSVIEQRVDEIEAGGSGGTPTQTLGTEGFMSSLSKFDKPLIKFCVAGDSLMGNDYGGAIPSDEGVGYRPIRLDINSVPRRIYDHIAFNKAEHRRLDVVEWVKSGAWTTVNDSSVWEPAHAETLYHKSVSPNAYAEIVIPDGMENFALICQKDEGFGVLYITLNGGDPSAYGPSSIDLARARVSASDRGNPYYTVEYNNLPAGVNTIRVAKQNNALECRVWGGFYWTGTTLVLHNIAHGGHTLQNLIDQHLGAELLENDFDAILFQITIMNEMSGGRSPEQTVQDMKAIISAYAANKDLMFITPNPFGDNGVGTNYYTLYTDPDMEDTSNACVESLKGLGVPYVNCFDMFKRKIENRGGTLLGGEGGLYYTSDGQHPNSDGAREWFNLIRPHISNKPYTAD